MSKRTIAAGELENATGPEPTHVPKTTPGRGWLTLNATEWDGYDTGVRDGRTLVVYEDHLARDIENFDGQEAVPPIVEGS